jgi:hypothetical protein
MASIEVDEEIEFNANMVMDISDPSCKEFISLFLNNKVGRP